MVHIVNQHASAHIHAQKYTRTERLIIIIHLEKGRVRDQLCPHPTMHCTPVSATPITFPTAPLPPPPLLFLLSTLTPPLPPDLTSRGAFKTVTAGHCVYASSLFSVSELREQQ